MTISHLKASRVWARGTPLIGLTAVMFVSLALAVGVHGAMWLMALMMLVGARRAVT